MLPFTYVYAAGRPNPPRFFCVDQQAGLFYRGAVLSRSKAWQENGIRSPPSDRHTDSGEAVDRRHAPGGVKTVTAIDLPIGVSGKVADKSFCRAGKEGRIQGSWA